MQTKDMMKERAITLSNKKHEIKERRNIQIQYAFQIK